MATSSSNFEFLFTVVANDSIPVSKYRSKETGVSVFLANVEGPLVNGYFCLGENIENVFLMSQTEVCQNKRT